MYWFVSGSLCFYSSCVFCLDSSSGFIYLGHTVPWGTWRKSDIYWWGGQSNPCCRCFVSCSWRELRHLVLYLTMYWQSYFRGTPVRILPEYSVYTKPDFWAGSVTRHIFLATKSGKFLSKTFLYPRAPAWASYPDIYSLH